VKQKLIYPFYKPLMSQYLKSVSKIVATSPAYVESSPVLQNFKNKVSIIPVGLNLNEYPKPKSENVEKYKAKFGGQFFIFIGVLRYYKGLHYLIEAVRNTTIQIVIAGSGSEASKLKDQAMDMKNVHFLGTISDQEKVDLLQAALAFVFPSHLRSEAYGLSLIEAAMQKKPLISCEIGTGTTYINLDQETGFTTKPNSPEALRFAMEKLKNNPDLAKIMGEKAHQRYVDLFTSDMMVESYAKVYNSLI
jgi:rhamnosyl/mannosyltransferase